MLRELCRGRVQGLIMHKIDRSARNLRDWGIISELPDIGVDVHIAAEPYDFCSRGGRLTADIQAVIAADYIRNLREETIKGLNGRLKQGLYPFRAPIGYRDNSRGKPKTICPIKGPARAPSVQALCNRWSVAAGAASGDDTVRIDQPCRQAAQPPRYRNPAP